MDAKKSYYCEHFQKHKLDIKKTYETIKQILNKDQGSQIFPPVLHLKEKLFKNEKDIADAFNKYFTNIGLK